ncbi:hypothetical protein D9M72_383880 [compost metagenome]
MILRTRRHRRLEAPDEVHQTTVIPQCDGGAGIRDGCPDLEPVPDNGGVEHQAFDVLFSERCHHIGLEVVERRPESWSLPQDGGPGQSGLKGLQADAFKQALLVTDRHAPFSVVVGLEQRVHRSPRRPGQAVTADDGAAFIRGHLGSLASPASCCRLQHIQRPGKDMRR